MNWKITAMYFSPTGTTMKVAEGLAQGIAKEIANGISVDRVNFTLPDSRQEGISFTSKDIVILGVPVYAGRVPNVMLKFLRTVGANGALGIPIVVYGNRAYDDAMIELKDIMEEDGFKVIAACTFIGEHAFSKTLAANRPDVQDMELIQRFSNQIAQKIMFQDELLPFHIPGHIPYRNYYVPVKDDGQVVDIRKVTPQTKSTCTNCHICVNVCPMGSIDLEDVTILKGICIKCGACVKRCPVQAKYYIDEGYLWHKQEIEEKYSSPRREPELFI